MDPFRLRPLSASNPNDPSRRKTRRPRLAAISFAALLLVASLLWMPAAVADEGLLRGPRRTVRTGTAAVEQTAPHQGIMERIAAAPVLFYQQFLGPSWGRQCSYHPSCSNYALLAVRKHGAFLGSIMAFDRLQHESDEGRYSPPILARGTIKVYDPLENNDYWWYRPDRPGAAASAGPDREATP